MWDIINTIVEICNNSLKHTWFKYLNLIFHFVLQILYFTDFICYHSLYKYRYIDWIIFHLDFDKCGFISKKNNIV